MLGHGKINFETPNVIDLGDMPPSRPSRLQKDFEKPGLVVRDSNSMPISDEDSSRRVYKPPLSRTIKLDYSLDADDEPNNLTNIDIASNDNGDDPEYGIAESPPSSPNVKQTRLFAANLLAESDRRASKRNLMGGMSSPLRLPFGRKRGELSPLRKAVGMDDPHSGLSKVQQEQRRSPCQRFLVLGAIVAIVVAFSVAAARAVQGRSRAVHYSSSMSSRMSATVDVLAESGISLKSDLLREESPQYQAAYWIANQDSERLSIPSNLDENPFQFVQRYVLTVLYYALNGNNWINSLNFTAGIHECGWFDSVPDASGQSFAVGVTCDDRLEVRNLLIRKYMEWNGMEWNAIISLDSICGK
jgi:hypothetical protein